MNDAVTWHRLGLAALRSGDLRAAVDALQHVAQGQPWQPAAWLNLGAALRSAGRAEEAVRCYDRAIALAPALPEAHNNRANALVNLARFEEALASCDRALDLRPTYPQALNNRAIVLCRLKRPQEALASLDRALELQPQFAAAYANRAAALIDCDRPEDALADCGRALQLDEHQADARNNQGLALHRLGRFAEALDALDQTLRLHAGYAEAHVNRGNVLRELGRRDEGLASIDRALQLQPDLVGAHNDRARLLADLGRHEEAAAGFARVVELAPDFELAAGHLLHCRLRGCDWTDYEASLARLLIAVEGGALAVAPLWCLDLTDSAAVQLACARTFARRQGPRGVVAPSPTGHESSRAAAGRLRVAYLSSDFRDHAVSRLLAGIFEQHDRTRFEVIGVSLSGVDQSDLGRRVSAAFDRWEEASRLSDAEIAAVIRGLAVDVLVDLNGWTRGMRPGVFARRPAPVQVSYLGYPGTSGASYMDWLIADEFVIPEATRGSYSERVICLPGGFQANDDRRAAGAAPTRAAAGLPQEAIVLGSFGRANKLTPPLFDVWCRFLRASCDSVLWLVADGDTARRNLLNEAQRRGIGSDRLFFATRLAYDEHLARLPLADLALDTFPFNGGSTTSDVLWAGVPVLTRAGEAFASRMTGSLLQALGLPELITRSLDEYERIGLELLQRPADLRALRSRLGANLRTTPTFDSRTKCRQLEAAYEYICRSNG